MKTTIYALDLEDMASITVEDSGDAFYGVGVTIVDGMGERVRIEMDKRLLMGLANQILKNLGGGKYRAARQQDNDSLRLEVRTDANDSP